MSVGQDFLNLVQPPSQQPKVGDDFMALVGEKPGIGKDLIALVGNGQPQVQAPIHAIQRSTIQQSPQPTSAMRMLLNAYARGGQSVKSGFQEIGAAVNESIGFESNADLLRKWAKQGREATAQNFPGIRASMNDSLRAKIDDIAVQYGGLQTDEARAAVNRAMGSALWKQRPIARAAEVITEGIPNYIGAIAATLITKNPTVGASLLGAQQGAGTYAESREAGEGKIKSLLLGAGDAALSTVLEKIPFDQFIGNAGKAALTRFIKGGSTEAFQELVQQFSSNAIAKYGFDKGRAITEGWLESVVGGAGLGGVGGLAFNSGTVDANPDAQQPVPAPLSPEADTILKSASPAILEAVDAMRQVGFKPEVISAWVTAPDEASREQILEDASVTRQQELDAANVQNETAGGAVIRAPTDGPAGVESATVTPTVSAEPLSSTQPPPSPPPSPSIVTRWQREAFPDAGMDPNQFQEVEAPTGDRAEDAATAQRMGDLFGKKVVYFRNNDKKRVNVWGSVMDDAILIDADAPIPYAKIAMHEALHQLRRDNQGLYDQLGAVVQDEGIGYDKFRGDMAKRYGAAGLSMPNENVVREEFVAFVMEDRGTDPTFWRDLYNKSPEAVQRLVDAIQQVIAKLKGKDVPEMAKYFRDFQRVHDTAVKVISEYAASRPAVKAPTNAATAATPDTNTAQAVATAEQSKGGTNAGQEEVRRAQGQVAPSDSVATGGAAATAMTRPPTPATLKRAAYKDLKYMAKNTKYASGASVLDDSGNLSRSDILAAFGRHRKQYQAETGEVVGRTMKPSKAREAAKKSELTKDNNRYDQQAEGEAETKLMQGYVLEGVEKDYPEMAKKYKGYGRTPKNPANVSGVEVYRTEAGWMARKAGTKKFNLLVEGKHDEIIAEVESVLPGVVKERAEADGLPFRPADNKPTVTPEQDAEYVAAVDRGDMETVANKIATELKNSGLDVSVTTGRRGHGGIGVRSGSYYINLRDITERVSQIRVSDHFAIKRRTQAWDTYADGYELADIRRVAMDEVYSDLVYEYEKRGRLDRLPKIQQMVDEAAKKAGFTIKAYHGTDRKITEFATGNKTHTGYSHFADKKEIAGKFARIAAASGTGNEIVYSVYLHKTTKIADGIDFGGDFTEYLVDNPSQVKSSDPVTRDDRGNVIPISERFNPQSNDTRFMLGTLMDEAFPESARPDQGKLAARMERDPALSPELRKWAKAQSYVKQSQDEWSDEATAWLDELGEAGESVGAARNRLMSGDHKLSSGAKGKASLRVIAMLDKAARDATDPKAAVEIVKSMETFAKWFAEDLRSSGQYVASMAGALTQSMDTIVGIVTKAQSILDDANKNIPGADKVQTEAEALKAELDKTVRQLAAEVAAKESIAARAARIQSDNYALAKIIAARKKDAKEAFAKVAKDETMSKVNKGVAGMVAEQRTAIDMLKAKFGKKAASAPLMAAQVEATMLDDADYTALVDASRIWIAQQIEAKGRTDMSAWIAWVDSTIGPEMSNFDNFQNAYDQAVIEHGDTVTRTTGKRGMSLSQRIRKGLKDAGTPLEKLIYEHFTVQEGAAKSLADRLVAAGFGKDSAALAVEIQKAMNVMLSEKAKSVLDKALNPKPATKRAEKNAMETMLRQIKAGALTDEALAEAFAKKYGINALSAEARAELVKYAERIAELKAKYGDTHVLTMTEKQKAMKYMAEQVKVGKGDVFWGYVHFNLLSGPMTHAFNMIANLANASGVYTTSMAQSLMKGDVRLAMMQTAAMLRGIGMGVSEARRTLATGESPLVASEKMDDDPRKANVFERPEYQNYKLALGAIGVPKKFLKYTRRLLQAEDSLARVSLRELRAVTMAAKVAKEEGLRGPRLENRVAELLGYDKLKSGEFEATAKAEGLEGEMLQRRVLQLMEEARGAKITEDTTKFSRHETFNDQFVHGPFGNALMALSAQAQRFPTIKPFVMFARVIANVVNMNIDYSPWGYVRAMRGTLKLNNGKTVSMDDYYQGYRADVYTKATFGTGLMLALGAAAMAALKEWQDDPDKDKKEPPFSLSGYGPPDPAMRKVWTANGGRPFSIRFGNGRSIKFGWAAPIAMPLAIVGQYMDAMRWGVIDNEVTAAENAERLALAVFFGTSRYVMDSTPMASVNQVTRMLGEQNTEVQEKRFTNFLASFTGYGVPNLYIQIAKIFDPTVYAAGEAHVTLLKNVPFARGTALKPSLNLMGEPVTYPVSERFWGKPVKDPELQFLVANKINITPPDRGEIVDPNTGQVRPMTEDEHYRWHQMFGPLFRERLALNIPYMQHLSPEGRLERVRDIATAARRETKAKLRMEMWEGRKK